MKNLLKIATLGLCAYLLFLYRTELGELILETISPDTRSTISLTDWSEQHSEVFKAIRSNGPLPAIDHLHDYLDEVKEELAKHDHGYGEPVTTRLDVVCELKAIHELLSRKYYQRMEEEKYYHHLTRHRDYLTQCSERVRQTLE